MADPVDGITTDAMGTQASHHSSSVSSTAPVENAAITPPSPGHADADATAGPSDAAAAAHFFFPELDSGEEDSEETSVSTAAPSIDSFTDSEGEDEGEAETDEEGECPADDKENQPAVEVCLGFELIPRSQFYAVADRPSVMVLGGTDMGEGEPFKFFIDEHTTIGDVAALVVHRWNCAASDIGALTAGRTRQKRKDSDKISWIFGRGSKDRKVQHRFEQRALMQVSVWPTTFFEIKHTHGNMAGWCTRPGQLLLGPSRRMLNERAAQQAAAAAKLAAAAEEDEGGPAEETEETEETEATKGKENEPPHITVEGR